MVHARSDASAERGRLAHGSCARRASTGGRGGGTGSGGGRRVAVAARAGRCHPHPSGLPTVLAVVAVDL